MRDLLGQGADREGTGRAAAGGATSSNGQRAIPAGAVELRAACLTLANSPAGLMTATSMVAPLTGLPGEVPTLRALSEELAELHGLDVAFRADGSSFTVRFSRRTLVATSAPLTRGLARAEQALQRVAEIRVMLLGSFRAAG